MVWLWWFGLCYLFRKLGLCTSWGVGGVENEAIAPLVVFACESLLGKIALKEGFLFYPGEVEAYSTLGTAPLNCSRPSGCWRLVGSRLSGDAWGLVAAVAPSQPDLERSSSKARGDTGESYYFLWLATIPQASLWGKWGSRFFTANFWIDKCDGWRCVLG